MTLNLFDSYVKTKRIYTDYAKDWRKEWRDVQEILMDRDDFPCTDQKAIDLCRGFELGITDWELPMKETTKSHRCMVYGRLISNDKIVTLNVYRQKGTNVEVHYSGTHPDYRLDGYHQEFTEIMTLSGLKYHNLQSATYTVVPEKETSDWTAHGTKVGEEVMPYYGAPTYSKMTVDRATLAAFYESDTYTPPDGYEEVHVYDDV